LSQEDAREGKFIWKFFFVWFIFILIAKRNKNLQKFDELPSLSLFFFSCSLPFSHLFLHFSISRRKFHYGENLFMINCIPTQFLSEGKIKFSKKNFKFVCQTQKS
jgi:hypothetical protein